ncbi:MAG: hypothetical protein NT138_01135 [Planctomycetales bacterium]|nr:hypothetical protein [Planctomycetales bacterium]
MEPSDDGCPFVNFTSGVWSGAKHTNANSSKAMVRSAPRTLPELPELPESQTRKLASRDLQTSIPVY